MKRLLIFSLLALSVSAFGQMDKKKMMFMLMNGESATSSTLLNNLTAYWKLDEFSDGSGAVSRLDSGENLLNLTDNNTTPSGSGLISNGADLEKTNTEFLSLAHNALIAGGPAVSWTMCGWYKPESLSVNDAIASKTSRWAMQVGASNGPSMYNYGAPAVSIQTSVATPEIMTNGVWHFLVWGYDASVGRAFLQINNGEKYEKAVTPVADASGIFYLGQFIGTYADGILDEFGRWSRVLTASETLTLYNEGLGLTYPFIGTNRTATTYVGPTSGASRLTNLQTAIDGGYSKIGFFGDSWTEGGGTGQVNAPLVNGIRASAQSEYGDAGIGFLKFQRVITNPDSRVTLFATTGTWSTNAALTGHGPDLVEVTATAAATIDFTATFDRIEIHYRQYTTGGSFQFRVDGGSWQVVNTAGAESYGKSAITGLSNVSHTVEIDWVSGTVVLFGAEMTSGSSGCLVYRIGTSGMQSTHPANNTNWNAALTALDLDCIIILLGTNDITNNVTPSAFAANLAATIAKVPLSCDIVIMPSPDEARDIRFPSTIDYNMMQYNEAAYNSLYGAGRVAWFSSVDDFGTYGLNYPRLYWGSNHLTTIGETHLSGLLYNAMFAGR